MIVDFELDSAILRSSLEAAADVRVTVTELTSTDVVPLRGIFWARREGRANGAVPNAKDDRSESHGALDRFERALDDDPTVDDAVRLACADGRRLYRVECPGGIPGVTAYRACIENDGVVLVCRSAGDGWRVCVRFPDRDAIEAFRTACEDVALPVEVRSVYSRTEGADVPFLGAGGPVRITEAQREMLAAAVEKGYFSIPREASLADVADELDVSGQAASKRLRRGMDRLVEDALDTERDGA